MGGSKTIVPPPPPAPDYGKVAGDTLASQIALAPQLFRAESNPFYGQTAYANLQNQVNDILLSGQMRQLQQYYPQLAQTETDYQTKLRQGELQQISSPQLGLGAYQQAFNQLTPGYSEAVTAMGNLAKSATEQAANRPTYTAYEQAIAGPNYGQYINNVAGPSADLTLGGLQAYKVGQEFLNQPAYQAGLFTGKIAGPELQSKLGKIDSALVESYMNQMPGVSGIAKTLSSQVQQDLAAGKSASEEDIRKATQAARQAAAARGTILGGQAIQAEVLNRDEIANQRYRERQAAATQVANTVSGLYAPALQNTFQRQQGAEIYNLNAQGQAFGQAMSNEELSRAAQAQRFSQLATREQALAQAQAQDYTQRFGLQELGLNLQAQQYQQAMGKEGLAQQTQNQAFQQALQRTQQGIAGQQAMLGLQAQQAQMGAAAMGSLQQAQAPVLQAFYRQPILSGAMGQSQQFALGGQQMAGPGLYNPESSMAFQSAFMPYQGQIAQNSAQMQANATASAGKSAMVGSIAGGVATGALLIF